MRERLVSYLLGELSPSEAAQVEHEVEQDPQLAKQLDHLRDCLFGGDCESELPSGLADRTADSVHDLVLGLERPIDCDGPADDGLISSTDAPTATCQFTLVDAGVAVGVVLALGMMLLPALQESRVAARRAACKNNLARIGQALTLYAEQHNGLFPHIEPGENAGMFAFKLANDQTIDRDELSRLILCNSSPLAEEVANGTFTVQVPKPSDLNNADPASLRAMRKSMGGSYAYRLGYLDGQLYMPIKNGRNSRSPLLSDAPNPGRCGRWQSLNHGGCGQNVLFEDGSVSYRSNCFLPAVDDNIFVNTVGKPAAGRKWNDSVLVSSEVTPGVMSMVQQPKRVMKLKLRAFRIYQAPTTSSPSSSSSIAPSRSPEPLVTQ